MGKIVSSLIASAALLLSFTTAKAEESNRGFYEAKLGNGGKIVFFASGNKVISVFALDTAGQKTYFGSRSLNSDGTFTLTLTGGVTITGKITADGVTASFASQNITANRVDSFGNFASVAGRYNGIARSKSIELNDVRFLVDSDGRIFFVGRNGDQNVGGSGNVNVGQRQPHHNGDGNGKGKGGDDASNGDNNDRDQNGNDEDADRDEHQDDSTQFFSGTFTITLTTGQTITGTVDFSRGHLTVQFTLNGENFEFNGDREATFNHLANISTRGFVNSGQGQLIGGFIITGGPKMVIIRASGPSLASEDVSPVLANPRLQLFQNNQLIKENDDWNSNSNAGDIQKIGLAPSDSKESALLVRLEPGSYTTVVSGADNGTGIALVEVYELDRD